MQLSLRALFWLLFAAALAIGWGWEGYQLRQDPVRTQYRFLTKMRSTGPTPSANARHKILNDLAGLSDAELVAAFEAVKVDTQDWQVYLSEIARRNLRDDLMRIFQQPATSEREQFSSFRGLLLTALRRTQGQLDPLTIHAHVPKNDEAGKRIAVPLVKAVLENVDLEQQDVAYHNGGDYRGGRPERWRIVLTDEKERTIEDSNFISFMGGGISSLGPMKFGEKHEFTLDARSYVAPPPTGRYTLQLFHSPDYLADEPDLAGLIVWESQPVQVNVTNPTTLDQRYVLLRFFAIVGMAVAVVVIPLLIRRRPVANASRKKSSLVRDLVALAVIVLLAIGWSLDTDQQKLTNFRSLPDAHSSWTMEEI